MRIHLQSTSHISLSRLIPAFPMLVTAGHGRSTIRTRGFNRALRPAQRLMLQPLESFELHLDGSALQPATCALAMELSRTGDESSLRALISRRVFVQPQHWSIQRFADVLAMSPTKIRRTLFTEGAAITELYRAQRLMRVLFEVAKGQTSTTELKTRVGWPAERDLESAFYDWFGVSLLCVRSLAMLSPTRPYDAFCAGQSEESEFAHTG